MLVVQFAGLPFWQLIPPMLLVTLPAPAPEILTVNVCWCNSVCVCAPVDELVESMPTDVAIRTTAKKDHATRKYLSVVLRLRTPSDVDGSLRF